MSTPGAAAAVPAFEPAARGLGRGAARALRRFAAVAAVLGLAVAAAPKAAAQPVWAQDFRRDNGNWIAFGDGARLEHRAGTMVYRYKLGGPIQLLSLPLDRDALTGSRSLRLVLRSAADTSLVVSLEEQGGGRFSTPVLLRAGASTTVDLALDDFVLATDAQAPRDADGRLDIARARQLSVVDAAGFLGGALGFFGLAAGDRELVVERVEFRRDAVARQPGTAQGLAGLDGDAPRWMVFGAQSARLANGRFVVEHERRFGRAVSLLRPLPAGALAGSRALRLDLGAQADTELTVNVEQSDGGKYEATLKFPGGEAVAPRTLAASAFKRAKDARGGGERPDWARVTQVALAETGGLVSPRGFNRLIVAGITGDGIDPAGARGGPAAAASPTAGRARTVVESPGWAAWTKYTDPVHSGAFRLVGDPSVMPDPAGGLRMVYNCFDPRRKRGAICLARSSDGLDWADVDTGDRELRGRIVRTRAGEWDDAQETPFEIRYKGEHLLYFVGYRDRGGFIKSFPAHVGMAWSKDGLKYERGDAEPVIRTSPGSWDNDAISSPSVVEHDGRLVMLYTAHCWTQCPKGTGITLLAATSDDGRRWTKRDTPVLTKADFPWAKDGIAEAEVSRGPDGRYYLFYSLLYGDDGHEVGVAVADSPFGPWRINRQPILKKSADGFDAIGPIAPTVVYEANRVRLWFHGFSRRKTIEIGYAEAPWPLVTGR